MKLVREHINEKFTQDSDPISDLGIGAVEKIENAIKSLFSNYGKYKVFFIKKYLIDKEKHLFKIKLVSIPLDETVVTDINEEIQKTYLNDCLIYPIKLKTVTFWSRLSPTNHYIAKIKSEYWDLFDKLRDEYEVS